MEGPLFGHCQWLLSCAEAEFSTSNRENKWLSTLSLSFLDVSKQRLLISEAQEGGGMTEVAVVPFTETQVPGRHTALLNSEPLLIFTAWLM